MFLIKEALTSHGIIYHLSWFSDGEQAVMHIDRFKGESDPPHVILLDLNLPKVDGKEVLGRIRSHPWLFQIPVAILTSSDSPVDRDEVSRLGASTYIRKPPTLDAFMAVGGQIRQLLERRAGAHGAA